MSLDEFLMQVLAIAARQARRSCDDRAYFLFDMLRLEEHLGLREHMPLRAH